MRINDDRSVRGDAVCGYDGDGELCDSRDQRADGDGDGDVFAVEHPDYARSFCQRCRSRARRRRNADRLDYIEQRQLLLRSDDTEQRRRSDRRSCRRIGRRQRYADGCVYSGCGERAYLHECFGNRFGDGDGSGQDHANSDGDAFVPQCFGGATDGGGGCGKRRQREHDADRNSDAGERKLSLGGDRS